MHIPEPEQVGPCRHDDPTPPEIAPGIQRFFQYPVLGRCVKFLTWWLIFSGIYASASVCPFCGQAGCPVGGASAGIVGGLFALVIAKGKAIMGRITQRCASLGAAIKSPREGRP
jgi:hypothetical protein